MIEEVTAVDAAEAGEPTTTPVIFRQWKGGSREVIALFPTIPAWGFLITSYQHTGQHDAANYQLVIAQTRPVAADLPEVRELITELVSRGYTDLKVYKRRQPDWVRYVE